MGDRNKSLSLPPGFRFHPTEQQILSFYLINKNNQNPNLILSPPFLCMDVISELDLYNYNPYDLPEIDSFPYGYGGRKKHWFYFVKGTKKKSRGGFWKRKCLARNVLGGGKDGAGLLGTKSSFVFYRRERNQDSTTRRCCRTNWIMIEYALVDHQMDIFVLCRVFLKTFSANKVLEAGLNSRAEEIFSAKNNTFSDVPSRQRTSVSGTGEVVLREDDCDNNVVKLPHHLTTELNNQVAVGQFSDNGIGSSLGVLQSDRMVNISNGLVSNGVTFDDIVGDELRTNTIFLEGDYLELDDLVGPLLGFGS